MEGRNGSEAPGKRSRNAGVLALFVLGAALALALVSASSGSTGARQATPGVIATGKGFGEVYAAVESPRGELGVYIVSDGGPRPYRMHVRDPSFCNLQTLPHMMRGALIADAVAIISSVDPIMGGVDR